jgi:hypothetical protein
VNSGNGRQQDISANSSEYSQRNKRSGIDRRQNKRGGFKYLLLNGRRTRIRREDDRQRAYFFDRYDPKLFAAIMTILMLSIFDALLTLYLIDSGSFELNPVMAYFLEYGPLPFFVAKYFLTITGVVILLIFKNAFLTRAKINTRSLFSFIIVAFTMVIFWQLFLILFEL